MPKTKSSERRLELVELGKLKKADRNPKRHALAQIEASIERFGFAEPLVMDERTGRLVSGHGRLHVLEQLRDSGRATPPGVQVTESGEWLVPVVRGWRSKNEREAGALLVAVNKLTEAGGWDQAELGELLRDLGADDLVGTGFTSGDLDSLLEDLAAGDGATPAAPDQEKLDQVPEIPAKPWVKEGQLFELGAHRLLVGDSTKPEDVARLVGDAKPNAMITDPPYAIFGSSTGIGADIADDKMIRPFFEAVLRIALERLPWFGHAYVFCDWRSWAAWMHAARTVGLTVKNKLVWDKGGSGLGSMWAQTYEEIGFFTKTPPAKAMSSNKLTGERTVYKPNVLRANRPSGKDREHNAAKPVGLLCELIEAAVDQGGVVLEPFCGSGSTLVACEAKGATCLAMEIEPKWAQVTIARWERVTGKKHRLLEK